MCALRDALDASDSIRFPPGAYGAVSRTNASDIPISKTNIHQEVHCLMMFSMPWLMKM